MVGKAKRASNRPESNGRTIQQVYYEHIRLSEEGSVGKTPGGDKKNTHKKDIRNLWLRRFHHLIPAGVSNSLVHREVSTLGCDASSANIWRADSLALAPAANYRSGTAATGAGGGLLSRQLPWTPGGEATEWGNGWEQIWKRLLNASVHVCDVKAPWVLRHDFLFLFLFSLPTDFSWADEAPAV